MRRPMAPQLSILVPVYNEVAAVERALDALLAADLPFTTELIVVDDGSTDGTTELLERGDWPANRVQVLHHGQNQGKGSAVRTALAEATGEFAAIFDADLEYDPARSEEHTSELQSQSNLVCRLLL